MLPQICKVLFLCWGWRNSDSFTSKACFIFWRGFCWLFAKILYFAHHKVQFLLRPAQGIFSLILHQDCKVWFAEKAPEDFFCCNFFLWLDRNN